MDITVNISQLSPRWDILPNSLPGKLCGSTASLDQKFVLRAAWVIFLLRSQNFAKPKSISFRWSLSCRHRLQTSYCWQLGGCWGVSFEVWTRKMWFSCWCPCKKTTRTSILPKRDEPPVLLQDNCVCLEQSTDMKKNRPARFAIARFALGGSFRSYKKFSSFRSRWAIWYVCRYATSANPVAFFRNVSENGYRSPLVRPPVRWHRVGNHQDTHHFRYVTRAKLGSRRPTASALLSLQQWPAESAKVFQEISAQTQSPFGCKKKIE